MEEVVWSLWSASCHSLSSLEDYGFIALIVQVLIWIFQDSCIGLKDHGAFKFFMLHSWSIDFNFMIHSSCIDACFMVHTRSLFQSDFKSKFRGKWQFELKHVALTIRAFLIQRRLSFHSYKIILHCPLHITLTNLQRNYILA